MFKSNDQREMYLKLITDLANSIEALDEFIVAQTPVSASLAKTITMGYPFNLSITEIRGQVVRWKVLQENEITAWLLTQKKKVDRTSILSFKEFVLTRRAITSKEVEEKGLEVSDDFKEDEVDKFFFYGHKYDCYIMKYKSRVTPDGDMFELIVQNDYHTADNIDDLEYILYQWWMQEQA